MEQEAASCFLWSKWKHLEGRGAASLFSFVNGLRRTPEEPWRETIVTDTRIRV